MIDYTIHFQYYANGDLCEANIPLLAKDLPQAIAEAATPIRAYVKEVGHCQQWRIVAVEWADGCHHCDYDWTL